MIYDKGLKSKVEPLANKYYDSKENMSQSEVSRLEDLIVSVVEDYVFHAILKNRSPLLADDIKQAARIGIVNAIRNYDPSKGTFCTWVLWQVKHTVNRDKSSHWIKVPEYSKDLSRKLFNFINEWRKTHKSDPNDSEVMNSLQWDERTLDKAKHVLSLQNSDLLDIPEETTSLGDKHNLKLDVSKAIEQLTPTQKKAVEMYYLQGYTMSEIASKLKVNTNNIQDILKRAKESLATSLKDYA